MSKIQEFTCPKCGITRRYCGIWDMDKVEASKVGVQFGLLVGGFLGFITAVVASLTWVRIFG